MALWANCTTSPLPSQTGWQPRREASETVFRLPPPLQSCWFRLPPNSAAALALGKPRVCQKTLLPAPFPASAGTWHSLLPPPVKALLPGMQVRRVKSQNNISPLPPRRLLPWIFNSLILLSMAYKAPCNLAPLYLISHHSLPPTYPSMQSSSSLLTMGLCCCCCLCLDAHAFILERGVVALPCA